MENYSTPIENIMHKDDTDNDTDNSNLTTAAKVLQKYNELENNQPDEQYNRDQINNETVQHQFESSYVNDHRMNELNRVHQYQQQQQYAEQYPPQQQTQYYQNPELNKQVQNKGVMSKFKNITNSIFNNLLITLVVVGLFILFNLKVVDTTLIKLLPSLGNGYNGVNMKGLLFKGLLVGIVFLIIKYFV